MVSSSESKAQRNTETSSAEASNTETSNTEASEAEAMFLMLADLPEPERSILGTSTARFEGGVVLSMANDPVEYWSKALGFGFDSPIDGPLVQRIVDRFRESGVTSATIQLAPHLLPADWDEISAVHGLTAESTWIKLAGSPIFGGTRASSAPRDDSDDTLTAIHLGARTHLVNGLSVGRVESADIPEWSNVIFTAFGMPPEHLASLMATSARSPHTEAFAVWDGDALVAGASLVVHGDIGHLAGAATLASHQGRGAHTALLEARLQSARHSGIRRIYAETGKPSQPGGNSSLNNMIRAGLRPIYERVNWRWTSPDAI